MTYSKAKAKAARKKQEKVQKTAKLGTGARFKAVEEAAKASGAKNPAAVAAMAGRKAHGEKKMAALSKGGKPAEKSKKGKKPDMYA